jgi:hypothetical protein
MSINTGEDQRDKYDFVRDFIIELPLHGPFVQLFESKSWYGLDRAQG